MFGARRAPARRDTIRGAHLGVHTESVVVADPDVANLARVANLNFQIGRGLRGDSGVVIGHEQGAPERSLTALVPGRRAQAMPTDAIAGVTRPSDAARLAVDYNDGVSADLEGDPFMSNAWLRIAR